MRDLDLQYWPRATFYQDMVQLVQTLGASHGQEQTAVLLNAAELYLTHMLLDEAHSTLSGITPEREDHIRRHQALSDAANLLDGQAVEDFETSPLVATARADASFWRSLQAIAVGDVGMLASNIQGSFAGLGMQSRAVLRAMLPVFIEAAIELRQETHADAAIRLMAELPDLASSSTGHFLRGRAHERRGNESSALSAYFEAVNGWDVYAARARLAIADMSLRNGGQGALLAAQSTLEEGREAWRGGEFELEILTRLAQVYAGTENTVNELLTYGKLITRFPKAEFTMESSTRVDALLASFYENGSKGTYPISEWMEAHLQLLPFFKYHPSFTQHTQTFADYLLNLGATDLAAKELRRAIRLVREREGEAEEASPEAFELSLKLAQAQIKAGLYEDAQVTLNLTDIPEGMANKEQHAALVATVLGRLGDTSGLLQTSLSAPTEDHLRQLALALAERENWAQSNDVFLQLWRKYPDAFTAQDATRLLIGANRMEDMETVQRVTMAFPALSENKHLIMLAKSISNEQPPLLPLRADDAATRLESLENAFESIKNTGLGE